MASFIKAIETSYKGHRFRSRLEARVAVFLDALGCTWSYEDEGYELPVCGRYLPDFFVHDFPFGDERRSIWIEVKGVDPAIEEINKLRELSCATGHDGFFMVGTSHEYGRAKVLFKDTLKPKEDYGNGICCYIGSELLIRHQLPHSTFSPWIVGKDRSSVDPIARKTFFKELDRLILNFPSLVPAAPFILASKLALAARFEYGRSGN